MADAVTVTAAVQPVDGVDDVELSGPPTAGDGSEPAGLGQLVDSQQSADREQPVGTQPVATSGDNKMEPSPTTVDTNELKQQSSEAAVNEERSQQQRPTRRGKRQPAQQRVHSCSTCNRTFNSRHEVVTHRYMHRENPTAFCSVCNKSFSSESAYKRHAATHNRKSRQPPRTCSQCNMQFSSMRQLSAHHAATHLDEKCFVCTICGTQFAWPENLRAHQRTHELDPHECELCGRRFVDATSLRVHTRNAHGSNSANDGAVMQWKHYSCKLCGRSFQFDFSLRAHMKGHAQSPIAAMLRQCLSKQHKTPPATPPSFSSSTSGGTPVVTPHTRTRYVRVDSKGVIDLGLDMTQAPVTSSQPSEIIVEVYNNPEPEQGREQAMDFSDVLDQSQSATTSMTHTQSQAASTEHHETTADDKLVWYVKPDSHEQQSQQLEPTLDFSDVLDQSQSTVSLELDSTSKAAQLSVTADEKIVWYVKPDTRNQQQQPQPSSDDDENGDNVNVQPTDMSLAAADADDGNDGEGDGKADNGEAGGGNGSTDADDEPAVSRHDDVSQHQQQPETSAELTSVLLSQPQPQSTMLTSMPAAAAAPLLSQPPSVMNEASDDDGDDADDEVDWVDVDPPRRRAAPFVYRQLTGNSPRTSRPREPFLFNCIMTDEKPFICLTCSQCFRWEISLNIHQRIHTDGTFPNKSRGSLSRPKQSAAANSEQRAKAKKASPADKSLSSTEVAGSCIVKHRRTSSDEDDDEFTFHVHADGPSAVSTCYSTKKRRTSGQRGQGRARGQGRGGRGQGRGIGDVLRVQAADDGHPAESTRYSSLRRQTANTEQGQGRGKGRGYGKGGGDSHTVSDGAAVKQGSSRVAGVKAKLQPSIARGGCNGVNNDGQKSVATDAVSRPCAAGPGPVHVKSSLSRSSRMWRKRSCYVCPWCKHVATSQAARQRHMQRAHINSIRASRSSSAPAVITCQFCSAQFASRWHLRHHSLRLHHAETGADTRGVVKCRKCRRDFTDKSRMRAHYRLHRAVVKPQTRATAL